LPTGQRAAQFSSIGFAKNERDNIDPDELQCLREIAAIWLAADAAKIALGLEEEALQEIDYDKKN